MKTVEYECAKCGGVFEQPIEYFDGFIEAVKIAAWEDAFGNFIIVNACCPDCFQHFIPDRQRSPEPL